MLQGKRHTGNLAGVQTCSRDGSNPLSISFLLHTQESGWEEHQEIEQLVGGYDLHFAHFFFLRNEGQGGKDFPWRFGEGERPEICYKLPIPITDNPSLGCMGIRPLLSHP